MTEGMKQGISDRAFAYLCCLVYFASYCTRINYAAVLLEIVQDMGITNEQASIAVLGSFVTYGAGQLVSGVAGDYIKPRTMIFSGLCVTSAINLLMSFLPDIRLMSAAWCINGFAQSMLWPPLVRIMAERYDAEAYRNVTSKVYVSASAATIAVYLLAPAAIWLSGWRLVFVFASALGFATALLWIRSVKPQAETGNSVAGTGAAARNNGSEVQEQSRSMWEGRGMKPFLICISCAIMFQGILRDGITTWMPTYVNDVFELGSSMSIFTAVVLPIFSIMSLSVTVMIQRRLGNELDTAALLFGIAMTVSLILPMIFDSFVVISVISMALITACMHGINMMLVSYLPQYFARFGKASSASGFLNAWTYVGSAISSYGFAALSERVGWQLTILLWAAVAGGGFVLCMWYRRRWKMLFEVAEKE